MKTRSSRLGLRALDLVLAPLRRARLRDLCVAGLPADLPGHEPVLIVANHSSWWDGFLLRSIHERLRPRSPFYVLMTERELRPRPWLRGLGAIGLQPGSTRSVRAAFRYLAEQRRRAPFVLFFPQGRIWPSTRRPLGFEPGISLLAGMMSPATIIPTALHIEPLNHATPTPFVSLGAAIRVEGRMRNLHRDLEERVAAELDALLAFLNRHGEQSVAAWPGALSTTAVSPGRGLQPSTGGI